MGIERYLCIGGVEVANPNRTLAYLRHLGNACLPYPPGSDSCCECPDWNPDPDPGADGLLVDYEAVGVGDTTAATAIATATFTDPATDDAPWYDPAVPASADVLGVWIEEARLGASWQREARPRQWGSSLGAAQQPGRELTIVGWVYTRSEGASAYARQWLFEALHGGSCFGGDCDLPDAEIYTHCNREIPDEGRRYLHRVGLTGWEPDLEPEFPRRCGFKFEATLTAEVPQLTTAPELLIAARLADGTEMCNVCHPCPELDSDPCLCSCLDTPVRLVPTPDLASCYCDPVNVFRTFVDVPTPNYWRDSAAIITVDAGRADVPGGGGLANLRIRGWPNPVGLTPGVDGDNPFECYAPCLDVEVACVPTNGTLIIDGATRRATVTCNGQTRSASAHISSGGGGRFMWPEVSCHGLMLSIDADVANTPSAAQVTVELARVERG